jgi:hypothetical protein
VITAGAGLSIWELDHYVRRFGWKLPVVNDGGAEAPSIGGFLAAGGIGESTLFYGGFWESVRSVTLVTGDGRSRVVGRRGSIFRWLFGSMGTLGIVYEVTLDLVPIGSARPVPVSNVASLRQKRPASWPAHLWLTLFVRERQREQAIERLNRLVVRHPKAWKPRQMYEYHLPHRRFSPPLLFAGRANFVAVGIWGDRIDGSDLTNYLALEADFQMLTEQTGFRRYFQTELIRKDRSLECYVGRTCAANYRSIKKVCDPKALLNQMSGRGVS